MDRVLLISSFLTLGYAILAVMGSWLCLRALDKLSGFDFSSWLVCADDEAKAIYFAGRIVAVCILMGLVMS